MWLNSEGKLAVTARARTLGHYMDSFNWSSQIDLKRLYDVYWVISDTYAYPHYRVLPELRRNGMKGKLPDCHPTRLMNALLADSRIETMMKSRDLQAVGYFVHHLSDLDRCWHSYKIAARNHYQPSDGVILFVYWSNAERTYITLNTSARRTSKLSTIIGCTRKCEKTRSARIKSRCNEPNGRKRSSTRRSPATSA